MTERVAVLRDPFSPLSPWGPSCPICDCFTPDPTPSLPGPKERPRKTICRRFQRFIVLSGTDGQTDSAARAVGPHHWHLGHGTRPNPVPGTLPGGFQSGLKSAPQTAPGPTPTPPPSLWKKTNKLKGEEQKHLRIRKGGTPPPE